MSQGGQLLELHVCRGLNTCAQHGKNDSGTMPGDGKCATAQAHHCAGHNECRGQGGCGYGSVKMQETPGENSCKAQGGCAVPITTNKSTEGKNKGKSVWELARHLFEARLKKNGMDVAPAPKP